MVASPENTPHAGNDRALNRELAWLRAVIDASIRASLGRDDEADRWTVPEPPPIQPDESLYGSFVHHYDMDAEERLTVILALAPHVRPKVLDAFFQRKSELGRGYSEFGGVQGRMHGGFLPTGETALFLLAGDDLHLRFTCQQLFDRDHYFARHNIVKLDAAPPGEPLFSGQLVLADEIVDSLTTGELRKPNFSRDFPAKLVTTEMDWEDLVLAPDTREQIRELEAWIRHEAALMNQWGLRRRLKPGYKALFHGPPGCGKTLTATVLGKRVVRDVYRVALSTVVSKYVGETEKNLDRIFDRAQSISNCILFFDEADALFGKRTNVSDAHDRYANQEVSYLLQRIEEYPGLAILASNYQSNIDDAFMRRFQAVVHFPMPSEVDRRQLWSAGFSERSALDDDVELNALAAQYELSGGAIMNVIRYASLMALDADCNVIRRADIVNGIRRELQKDGRTV